MSPSVTTRSQSKRARCAEGEEDKENIVSKQVLPPVKKQKVDPASTVLPSVPKDPDLYRTLPAPTNEYVQLRFQLQGQRGVYRSVQLPLNYTFAHLHTLIQYLFGWSGKGTHKARAYTNVETHKLGTVKEGCIKKKGEAPEPPDCLDEITGHIFEVQHGDAAIYEVVPVGQNTNGPSDFTYHHKLNDHELELNEVWNEDEDQNLSHGESINDTIGVIYEYDKWSVHITLDWMCTIENPSNDIFLIIAKGAPDVEDRKLWSPEHPHGSEKTVSSWLFDPANFQRYCQNKVGTRVFPNSLSAYMRRPPGRSDEWIKIKREQIQIDAHRRRIMYEKSEKEYRKEIRLVKQRELEERAIDERASRRQWQAATLLLMTTLITVSTAAVVSRKRSKVKPFSAH